MANRGVNWSGMGEVKCRSGFGLTAQKTFALPQCLYSRSGLASGQEGAADRIRIESRMLVEVLMAWRIPPN